MRNLLTLRNPYGDLAYGYIYKFTDKHSGRYYIGQHVSKTFDVNYTGSGSSWKNVTRKYKWNKAISTKDIDVEVLCWCINQKELNRWERFFIVQERATITVQESPRALAVG